MEARQGLWVYCVIENKGIPKWDVLGIHGTSPVYLVGHDDFAMVVSQEPMKKYPLVRDTLIAHQLVNEKVMQLQPVLPVRFCTMAENEEQIIEEVLKRKERIEEFHKTLTHIRDKNEFGLRARWKDLEQVFVDIGKENEKVKTAKEQTLKFQGEKQRMALIEVGHVVKDALEEKKGATTEDLLKELIPLSSEYKENNVLGDMNILNAAFLVEKKKQEQFDEAVNKVVSFNEDKIQFRYVGPTPPFNFVEIVILWNETGKKGEA